MNITSQAFLKGVLFTAIFSISGFSADFDSHDKHGGKVRVMLPTDGGQVDHKVHASTHSSNAVNNDAIPANDPASKRTWTRTIVGVTIVGGLSLLYLLNPFSTSKKSIVTLDDPKTPSDVVQLHTAKSPFPPAWYDSRFSCYLGEAPEDYLGENGSTIAPETCPKPTSIWEFSATENLDEKPYLSQAAYNGSFTLSSPVKNILEFSIADVCPIPFLSFNGTVCPVIAAIQLFDNVSWENTDKSLVTTQKKEAAYLPSTDPVSNVVHTTNRVPKPNTEASGFFWFKVAGGVVLIASTVSLDLLRRYNNAVETVNGVMNSTWRQWWPTARAHTWWYVSPEVWQEVRSSYLRTLGM